MVPLPMCFQNHVLHSRCASIGIEADDPHLKRSCLALTRSQRSIRLDCKPGPSEQVCLDSRYIVRSKALCGKWQKCQNKNELQSTLVIVDSSVGGKMSTITSNSTITGEIHAKIDDRS